MKIFQVPQKKLTARVRMKGDRDLDGVFYYAAAGPGGGEGRLTDRLNDADERFLPLAQEGRGCLLNKEWILIVTCDAGLAPPEEAAEHHIAVQIHLADGTDLEGRLHFTMPPGRERLLDFINAAPRFIPVYGDGVAHLVNRDAITSIEGNES